MLDVASAFLLRVCVFALLASEEEPDRVRTLLEDVENVRRAKMYEGMGTAAQEVQQAVKVLIGVVWLRGFLCHVVYLIVYSSNEHAACHRRKTKRTRVRPCVRACVRPCMMGGLCVCVEYGGVASYSREGLNCF